MRFNSRGFTFLELIVVLVILGIAGSLVFVSVGRSVTGKRSRIFVQDLASLCRKARTRAVSHGLVSTLYISSEQRKCWVDNRSPLNVPEEIKIEGERIAEIKQGIYGIRFYPDGSSSGGDLYVSRNDHVIYAFRIDVLTGSVTALEKEE